MRESSTRCHQTVLQSGQSEALRKAVQNVQSQPSIISLSFCHKTASQGIPSGHGSETSAQKEKEMAQDLVMISGN